MSKIILPPVTDGCFRAKCMCGCLFDTEKESCEILFESTSRQYDKSNIDGMEKVIGWMDVTETTFSCNCPACGASAIGKNKEYGEFHLAHKFNK